MIDKKVSSFSRLLLGFLVLILSLPSQNTLAQAAQPGSNFSAGNGMEMVWVDPLKGWVGKNLVTQEQYEKVMGSNPSRFKGPRHPVEMVSWNEAMDYCKKLTDQDHASGVLPAGAKYNLPSDAQFDAFVGNAGGMDDAAELLLQQKPNLMADVGSKGPNEYGLFDTRGLIWQWVLDDFQRKSNEGLPITKSSYVWGGGEGKVLRGGTVPHYPIVVPLAYRNSCKPGFHFDTHGFRVVVIPAG